MDRTRIVLLVSIILGTVIIITGIVFLVENSRTGNKNSRTVDRISQTKFKTPIAKENKSSVLIPSCASDCNTKWTVKCEAATNNIGTPLNRKIKNWNVRRNPVGDQFKLKENGWFEIKEGYYEIKAKITFQATEKYESDVPMLKCSNGEKVNFSLKNLKKDPGANFNVATLKTCANVTGSQLFVISLQKYLQILFFPKDTFFTITKCE